MTHPIISRPLQARFLEIPQTSLCYWLCQETREMPRIKTVAAFLKELCGIA